MGQLTTQEIMKKRLEKCKTCTWPDNDIKGLCPGNLGLGCLGDWRCCDEIFSTCENCDCNDYWYCEKKDCEQMNSYRNGK